MCLLLLLFHIVSAFIFQLRFSVHIIMSVIYTCLQFILARLFIWYACGRVCVCVYLYMWPVFIYTSCLCKNKRALLLCACVCVWACYLKSNFNNDTHQQNNKIIKKKRKRNEREALTCKKRFFFALKMIWLHIYFLSFQMENEYPLFIPNNMYRVRTFWIQIFNFFWNPAKWYDDKSV